MRRVYGRLPRAVATKTPILYQLFNILATFYCSPVKPYDINETSCDLSGIQEPLPYTRRPSWGSFRNSDRFSRFRGLYRGKPVCPNYQSRLPGGGFLFSTLGFCSGLCL